MSRATLRPCLARRVRSRRLRWRALGALALPIMLTVAFGASPADAAAAGFAARPTTASARPRIDIGLQAADDDPADEPASVSETITIRLPALPAPDARGDVSPVTLSPDERRRRFRRQSHSPLATERIPRPDGSVTFAVRNLLQAPLTIEMEPGATQGATVSLLAQPKTTLAPLGRLDVASVRSTHPLETAEVTFIYSAVIGDPKAVHDPRVVYAWPFAAGVPATLGQGPNGPTHRDVFSRYAIDLAVPEGTPVLAARAGTIVALENRYFESGLDRERFGDRANHVRILHEDGSMGLYAHLFPDSIDLAPGQRVEVGQRIGLSGNTGYSSGPHLHFVVLMHRDMRSVSVPFRMVGIDAP